jgi:hypothetical protein
MVGLTFLFCSVVFFLCSCCVLLCSVVFFAHLRSHLPLVQVLLKHGCSIAKAMDNGITPVLVSAAHSGSVEMTQVRSHSHTVTQSHSYHPTIYNIQPSIISNHL